MGRLSLSRPGSVDGGSASLSLLCIDSDSFLSLSLAVSLSTLTVSRRLLLTAFLLQASWKGDSERASESDVAAQRDRHDDRHAFLCVVAGDASSVAEAQQVAPYLEVTLSVKRDRNSDSNKAELLLRLPSLDLAAASLSLSLPLHDDGTSVDPRLLALWHKRSLALAASLAAKEEEAAAAAAQCRSLSLALASLSHTHDAARSSLLSSFVALINQKKKKIRLLEEEQKQVPETGGEAG